MYPLLALALWIGGGLLVLAKATSTKRPDPPPDARIPEETRAFISFDFDNNLRQKNLFAGQCRKRSPTPFSVQDWSSKGALPQAQWEQLIFEKIGRCHLMFVLVSPTSHKATGVAKEIAMADKHGVPMVGVYVAGADGRTPLPAGLTRDCTIRWEWDLLKVAINRSLEARAS